MAWTHTRAKIATAVRDGEPEEKIADLRKQLRAERLELAIRNVVGELTPQDRARLAALLRPTSGRRSA